MIIMLFFILLLLKWQGNANIFGLEGFGSDMKLEIDSQVVVASEDELRNVLDSRMMVRFAPNCNIDLRGNIKIVDLNNVFITGPVTFYNFGIYVQNSTNIILTNMRILNASIYGILIFNSHNVVVDHCTIIDAGRTSIDEGKCIDITQQTSNVTVSYNILGFTYPVGQLLKYKGILIANFKMGPVGNVSVHHNLFYCVYQRSPEISSAGLFDLRENIVFNYTEYGSRIRNGAFGNFVGNRYIGGKKDPMVFLSDNSTIYAVDNLWKFNCSEYRQIPDIIQHKEYTVPEVTSKSERQVLREVGCLKRQLLESRMVAEVNDHL